MSDGDQSPVAPYLRIATQLREQIHSGELQPGDKVPPARQIAQDWGVARQTADRALSALRSEGLIVATAGRGGTKVATPTTATFAVAIEEPVGLRVASAEVTRASEAVAGDLDVPPGSAVVVIRLERQGEN